MFHQNDSHKPQHPYEYRYQSRYQYPDIQKSGQISHDVWLSSCYPHLKNHLRPGEGLDGFRHGDPRAALLGGPEEAPEAGGQREGPGTPGDGEDPRCPGKDGDFELDQSWSLIVLVGIFTIFHMSKFGSTYFRHNMAQYHTISRICCPIFDPWGPRHSAR